MIGDAQIHAINTTSIPEMSMHLVGETPSGTWLTASLIPRLFFVVREEQGEKDGTGTN